MINRKKLFAYVLPMALFLALLSLNSALKSVGGSFALSSAEYWIYPLQTLLCGILLFFFRRQYAMTASARPGVGLFVGLVVFLLWISPQALFGFPSRFDGFNPEYFTARPAFYWGTVSLRFLRLVVVVPLVEEIFWRGFLLRFLIDEDFERVPFGAFSWLSFVVVALAFGFSHNRPDWLAAVLAGMLYNWVAYRSRSLSTCVVTHALTNLLLGLWIMKTGQWGFW